VLFYEPAEKRRKEASAMAPQGSKIGVEEKGQRAARSTDVYIGDSGVKEVAVCSGCNALYWNKRWYPDESVSTGLSDDMIRIDILCPACHRIQDNNPAGVVTYSGNYLQEHKDEILNTIKNSEEKSRLKNPLARIMEIKEDGNSMIVNTTDDKLAQKLGRDIFKAHSGSLEYKWSREHNFIRVNWNR
jgi:NMD protein affecting ribosome stability and mRNA decay